MKGDLPPEHGWYKFDASGGRFCSLIGEADPDPSYEDGQAAIRGYIIGDRFIPDGARVDPDPAKLIEQTVPVACVEPGLDRFTRAVVIEDRAQQLVYMRQEFPLGPETEALMAYQDRKPDISHVVGATPALDLAFRWITYQREMAEERRRELERIRLAEEAEQLRQDQLETAMRHAGSAVGRRKLAVMDFETAAREALRVSDAELLDVRDSHNRNEKVVQYRFRHRRLECVVDKKTLRIVDAGICLQDHETGVKGDTRFSLESLPSVIGEAMDLNKLVVYRHVDGDEGYRDDYYD